MISIYQAKKSKMSSLNVALYEKFCAFEDTEGAFEQGLIDYVEEVRLRYSLIDQQHIFLIFLNYTR